MPANRGDMGVRGDGGGLRQTPQPLGELATTLIPWFWCSDTTTEQDLVLERVL